MATFVTVALDQPIDRADSKIESLQIRKPGTGELRGLKLADVVQMDVDAMITMLPRITKPPLTEPEVAALDLADFIACCDQVAGFLPQQGASTASRPR